MIPDFDKGQHFLLNVKKVIEKSNLSGKDKVLEIGAGKGSLTEEIAKKAGKVLAFEVDERLKKPLEKLEKKYSNLKIIYGDALKHDWRGHNKIVSNIPYFISGNLIIKSVEDDIEEIIITVGEKFKKILEEKNSKAGIIANIFFEVEYLLKIGKEDFSPAPRVNSWLVRMKRKKAGKWEKILESMLKKKGKIKNAIIYSFVENGLAKKQAREFIENSGVDREVLEKSVKNITGKFLARLIKDLENLKSP